MMSASPIKLTSARSRFFTAAKFPKQKLDAKQEDSSDITFVLSISASVEQRVALDAYGSKGAGYKETHWPNVSDFYEVIETIGVGSYALVHSAFCRARDEYCAIKIFDLKKWSQSNLDNLLKEVVTVSTLSHNNITTYYSTFVNKDELWLVMKHMEHGSLLDVIRRKQKAESCKYGVFDEDTIATIMSAIVNGLMFLHELGYIYKDLKAENILIGEDGSVKIADFCIVNCISKIRSYVGSPRWLAPEIIKDKEHKYTPKADVWSLGITALETATGSPPYHKFSSMKVLLMISLNEPPTLETDAETRDQYEKYGRKFRSFIADCLKKDPTIRPHVKELLFHPFFKKTKDQKYLRGVFASIPSRQEHKLHLPKKEEREPLQPKERKEWFLTSAEILADHSSSPELGKTDPGSAYSPGMKSEGKSRTPSHGFPPHVDDASSPSYWRHMSSISSFKKPIGQVYQVVLKIRGINLDTPMVLKTGINIKRELFDIAFPFDTVTDKPASVVEDLVREGLIDPKDRPPVLTNLKRLLDFSSRTEGNAVSSTFRLNSDITRDETLSEGNLIGYAALTLKPTADACLGPTPSFRKDSGCSNKQCNNQQANGPH